MTRYVVDSHAWVEYLGSTALGERVRELVEDEDNEVFTSALNLTEIVSRAEREGKDGRKVAELVEGASVVVPLDFTSAVSAGRIHADRRKRIKDFPYGDAAVLALGRTLRAKVLSGDPHFRGEEGVIFLE